MPSTPELTEDTEEIPLLPEAVVAEASCNRIGCLANNADLSVDCEESGEIIERVKRVQCCDIPMALFTGRALLSRRKVDPKHSCHSN